MTFAGNNLTEAAPKAARASRENPGKYIILVDAFGLFIIIKARLHVNDPTSTRGGCYWLNGTAKVWTKAKLKTDQVNTPAMV